MTFPDLSDWLRQDQRFAIKRKLLLFSDLIYKPSSEKVEEGFRYFACGIDQLLSAFGRGDFEGIAALPFATDEDGDADTSAVMLNIAYTESGAMVAAQPVEYQNHNPTAVAPPMLVEGEQAKRLIALVKKLDQSNVE